MVSTNDLSYKFLKIILPETFKLLKEGFVTQKPQLFCCILFLKLLETLSWGRTSGM